MWVNIYTIMQVSRLLISIVKKLEKLEVFHFSKSDKGKVVFKAKSCGELVQSCLWREHLDFRQQEMLEGDNIVQFCIFSACNLHLHLKSSLSTF